MLLTTLITFIVIIITYKSFPLSTKVKINILLSLSVALQGAMLAMIVLYQNDSFDSGLFFQCLSIYTISWLIGFITPGASGGLGIREGTFVAITTFLELNIASDIIIFSVLLVRLINILIDIILFLSTFLLTTKIAKD